jgi:flavin reductase (DIM6/NTAB) family NADH-FMN oxidoreductase RutF
VDAASFRRTLGQFVTGVTVLATEHAGAVHGMTANAFTSLSLDPPLVLICVRKAARMGGLLREMPGFSINILSRDQQDLSSYFAGVWKGAEPPAFEFGAWAGVPRLGGCVATLACEVHAVHEGGDHWIVIGRVTDFERAEPARIPLVFFGGRYVGLEDAIASR